jgi:hypothetical protein
MAASEKIPAASGPSMAATASAWPRCGPVESTMAREQPNIRTSSASRASVPRPNTTRVGRPEKTKLSITTSLFQWRRTLRRAAQLRCPAQTLPHQPRAS